MGDAAGDGPGGRDRSGDGRLPGVRVGRPGLILLVCAAAQALGVGSASIVGVALPSIAADLGASSTAQQWIVDAYVLVFAALLVTGGVLGDRRGRRSAFLLGLALFAAGSLVCALAPSTGVLIAGRVLQGLGSPILLPASLALVTMANPETAARARAIGLWSIGSGLGLTLGPVVGGALAGTLGWEWVFAFNVPVCIVLGLVATRIVPRTPAEPAREPFDAWGALGSVAAIGALVFAIIEGRSLGWSSPVILVTFATAAVAAVAWVAWEGRQTSPLVDVRLFRGAAFAAACLTATAASFALIGVTIFFATFFQEVQGRSALVSGLCVLPLGLGVMAAAPVAGRLAGRTGPRAPLIAGLVLATAAILVLVRVEAATPSLEIWPALLLAGLGAGMALPTSTVVVVAAVAPERAGMAVAINNTLRQTGQALGVAVLGTIIFASADGFVPGLHRALLVAAAVTAISASAVALLVPRGAGGAPART